MTRRHRRERGQAAVEFALVLPLFLLLVFGIIEFGRVWMVQQVLTTASRAGARRAILPTTTDSQVVQTVNNLCTAASLDLNRVGITSTNVGINGTSGQPSQVTVTYNHQVLSGSIIPGLNGTITLTSTTSMRHE